MSIPPSLYRVPFLLANLVAGHITTLPPNKDADQDERKKYEDGKKALEPLTVMQWLILPLIWAQLYTFQLSEMYITLAAAYPAVRYTTILNILLPTYNLMTPLSYRLRASPALIIGTCMCVSSCTLRLICYRTLGRQFTFELALKKDHKLITHGPYSVVRHPAYTGQVTFFSGLLLTEFGPGSWWSEAGMWSTTLGKVLGTVWVSTIAFVLYSLVSRVPKEDRVLQKEFGKKWEEWAKRTPYKLVPGVC
ncbi:hypothetical protein EUX98_g6571 [Antrodiella citrinella]|uniref:Protein-S-isoprenylcysteine O-methyltransferase n=1 Tax=Antrodiella citrinella TaxID=2447956 RepID=A0A4S4MW52_9APHY|nr:hypothetical protein EUX98_g6571 [Antrodiella citrinella]